MPKIIYEAELNGKEYDLFSEFLKKLRELRQQESITLTTNDNGVSFGDTSISTTADAL